MRLLLRAFAIVLGGAAWLSVCRPAYATPLQQTPTPASPLRAAPSQGAPSAYAGTVIIPGPLRSFLRMAGISQEVAPQDVLPLLSRNVSLHGYQGGKQTEYLLLLDRYVQYARELRLLTSPDGAIHVAGCADAARLIALLGYQFQRPCGEAHSYLVTAQPERAFLTLDSGFPLTVLEEALSRHAPFSYSFPATPVPVLFREKDWTAISPWRRKSGDSLLDVMLHDRNLDWLYWALSRMDEGTQIALNRSPGLKALLPSASVLELYGSELSIRSGRVFLPGGPAAERNWEELVEANPGSPASFISHLLEKDGGWLAAYFDALSRLSPGQQRRLTQGARLSSLYAAYRAVNGVSRATAGVYARNGDLLILFSRLRWQPNGEPYVPGSLGLWRELLSQSQDSSPKLVRGWVKNARRWDDPEQLLAIMVACSASGAEASPSQLYLALSAIDGARAPNPALSDGTIRLLAAGFAQFHDWYPLFSEFSALNDASIEHFLSSAQAVTAISVPALRSNALGALQANVGLWEILARQRQIPGGKMNPSFQGVIDPFAAVSSSVQLFAAARASLNALEVAATGSGNLSEDQIVDLLAGPPAQTAAGRQVHDQLAGRMRAVMDDQSLVSIDTLFALYDGLDQMAHGSKQAAALLLLAGDLRGFEMPHAIFTAREKSEWAPQIYSSRHAELQVRTDLTRVIQSPGSPAELQAARGQLTPFLRDTLVGLNYAYYEPPGAQVLHQNPLFVRSHDFSGASIMGMNEIWNAPRLIGIGITAGGGAYLIGSLADLPYVLASTEEDFIAPEHVQALIWKEIVPELLAGAVEPRWWNVTQTELHAAALYQRSGEELLLAAPQNPQLRARVLDILSGRLSSQRVEWAGRALLDRDAAAALIPGMLPAETFYLSAEYRERFPDDAASWGPAGRELDQLARTDPSHVSAQRLSTDFGVPHPTLAQTNAPAILNLKPFPAFGGNASRLFGESWESSNLYWARLADEKGYSPEALNLLAPELTRRMIAKLFATDTEDWPALLRAMQAAGGEFRDGKIHAPPPSMISQR